MKLESRVIVDQSSHGEASICPLLKLLLFKSSEPPSGPCPPKEGVFTPLGHKPITIEKHLAYVTNRSRLIAGTFGAGYDLAQAS